MAGGLYGPTTHISRCDETKDEAVTMSSRAIALIIFGCIFGSAVFGFLLRKILPDQHLDSDSKDIVKLATGLIATMSALVLGLLVSAAKGTFDQANSELTQLAVRTVVLDRVLAAYGPEATEIRVLLKNTYTTATQELLSGDENEQNKLDTPEAVSRLEGIQSRIRALSPKTEEHRGLQARALALTSDMANARWLLVMQRNGSISTPMLVVMVFWLSIVFAAWGVFSPRNLTVATALLASALAVSGATFLILEMDRPLTGWIRVSAIPMQTAVSHLGE